MSRKVGDGKSVVVAVPPAMTILAGHFYLLDGVLGIATQGVVTDAAGDVIEYNGNAVTAGIHPAEVVLNIEPMEVETSEITPADPFLKGDRVYWNAGTGLLTTDPTAGIFCGVVTVAKDANGVIWFLFVSPVVGAFEKADAVAVVAEADVAAIVAADGAAVVSPDAADAAGANPTKAEYDAAVDVINETKATANGLVTLVNEVKGNVDDLATLANANKAAINAIIAALKAANLMA